MKILIVGAWRYKMYEAELAAALERAGYTVQSLEWDGYFSHLFGKIEEKYSLPGLFSILFNRTLVDKVREYSPSIVIIWRGTNIFQSTLKKLKLNGVQHLVSYNHDDFSGPLHNAAVPWHHKLHWRMFLNAVRYYDHHFVKRESNIEHLKKLGSHSNHIMPMWFSPRLHKPVSLSETDKDKYSCDVVFVGHYEPDERVNYLGALIEAGVRVKVFGGSYWSRSNLGKIYQNLAPIVSAEGEEYAKALCGAKICLVFLSKLNRDTYTRRCFEIPACGKLMLSERTENLSKMFEEGLEACFFSDKKELVSKVLWLLDNPEEAEKIAEAGRLKVWRDGHSIDDRVRELISTISPTPT